MKAKKQLSIIFFLILIFFGLLFISTTDIGISQKLKFEDNIEINNFNNVIIGEINLKNDGFIPKRILLDKFVVCQISDSFGTKTYKTNYLGSKTNYAYLNPFDNYRLKYIDISSGEEIKFDIQLENLNSFDLNRDIVKYDLNYHDFPFYIFKVDKQLSYVPYDYCNSLIKEDADYVINLKLNISKSELENVKVY